MPKSRKSPAKRAAKAAPKRKTAAKRVGRTADANADRRRLFVEYYIANGNNARQAAIAAGFSTSNASHQGAALLHDPVIARQIAARARQVAALAEMTTENWAAEVRAIVFSRPGDFYDAEGNLIPPDKLPDRVQAALGSVKQGRYGLEYKLWDKNAALVTMAKHLGLFEKDNDQNRPTNIRVIVDLV